MLLYWISLIICGIVIIPLFSNPSVYLEKILPEDRQTDRWYKIILITFTIMCLCPVINTGIFILLSSCAVSIFTLPHFSVKNSSAISAMFKLTLLIYPFLLLSETAQSLPAIVKLSPVAVSVEIKSNEISFSLRLIFVSIVMRAKKVVDNYFDGTTIYNVLFNKYVIKCSKISILWILIFYIFLPFFTAIALLFTFHNFNLNNQKLHFLYNHLTIFNIISNNQL